MRELVLGILIGVAIALAPNWWEAHPMFNVDSVFYTVLGLIVIVIFWRPILNLIDRFNPKFIRRLYEFWASPQLNEEHKKREDKYDSEHQKTK
jgi:hypothetical protein